MPMAISLTSADQLRCGIRTASDGQPCTRMQARRVDVVVPGAVLLDEMFTALNITEMRVSPFALREGVLQVRICHRLIRN